MSGSIHNFIYQAGNGQDYAVRMDKSNGLIVGNAQLGNELPGLPANIQPRYALYQSADGKVSRKIIVCSRAPNVLGNLPQSFTDPYINATGSSPVFLKFFSNEKVSIYSTTDTGLTT